jgi:uncharacterized protein YegP (UPF0339 family)
LALRAERKSPQTIKSYGDAVRAFLRWCDEHGHSPALDRELMKAFAGKFRFHLKAPNGEIIAASQGYESKASAEKGIEAIKTHAPGATVEDHTG